MQCATFSHARRLGTGWGAVALFVSILCAGCPDDDSVGATVDSGADVGVAVDGGPASDTPGDGEAADSNAPEVSGADAVGETDGGEVPLDASGDAASGDSASGGSADGQDGGDSVVPQDASDDSSETGDTDDTKAGDSSDTEAPDADSADSGADVTPPAERTLVVLEPPPGASLAGAVELLAEAGSPYGEIEEVSFHWKDLGLRACTASQAAGWTCIIEVGALPPGPHVLVAVARDGAGPFTSVEVPVTLAGGAAPGTAVVGGLLVPPAGAPAGYELGNRAGAVEPAASGAFALPVQAPGVTLTIATLDAEGDTTNDLFALSALVAGDVSAPPASLVVSPRSTAVALVFLHPAFATPSPTVARALLDLAEHVPAIDDLEDWITQSYAATPDPFGDPDFQALYLAAVADCLALLPAPLTRPATGAPPGNLHGAAWHPLDHFRQFRADVIPEEGTVLVEAEPGMPLSGVVRFARVDLDAAHPIAWYAPNEPTLLVSEGQLEGLTNRRICEPGASFYPMFETLNVQTGYVHADSLYGYLDVLGIVIDAAASYGVGLVHDLLGVAEPAQGFAYAPSQPGVYVMRVFTGKLHTGAECGELEFVASRFPDEHRAAIAFNVVSFLLEVVSLVVDVSDYAEACTDGVVQALGPAVASIPVTGDQTPSEATRGALFDAVDVGTDALAGCIEQALGQAAEDAQDIASAKVLSKLSKAVKSVRLLGKKISWSTIDKLFNPLGVAAAVGSMLDRVATMLGNTGLSPATPFTSPMDTLLLRVGNPFSPTVVAIDIGGDLTPIEIAQEDPRPVAQGAVVTLVGADFRPHPDSPGKVPLGLTDRSGRRRTVSGNLAGAELTFAVPTGLAGAVSVSILHPPQGAELGEVLVIVPTVSAVSPGTTFIPLIQVGGNYDPAVRLSGAGFDPETMTVLLETPSGPVTLFHDPGFSSDTELVAATEPTTPPGTFALLIDTGIDSPAFAALHPGGRVDTGRTLTVLPAPVIPAEGALQPESVGGNEVFTIGGFNLGERRDALRLVLQEADGAATTVLPILALEALPGGDVQASKLTTRLGLKLVPPFPASMTAKLRTPSGETTFEIPIGEEPWPIHGRTISVNSPSAWQTGVSFVTGLSQPEGHFSYQAVNVAPEGEPPVYSCELVPPLGEWAYDIQASPPPPITSTYPPARAGDGVHCPAKCTYTEPNSFNQLLGLPTSPCPNTWEGVTAGDIRDTLTNGPGVTHLPPLTIDGLLWTDVAISVQTGGGLLLKGISAKPAHSSISLSVASVQLDDPEMPVLELVDIEDAVVIANIKGTPDTCHTGIRLVNCRAVLLNVVITGCRTGLDIDGSEAISIAGSIRGYGGGAGLDIHGGSRQIQTQSMEIRGGASASAPPSSITAGSRGVRIRDGAEGVTLHNEYVTSNEVGIEVLDATDVVIRGTVGAPPPIGGASANPLWGNHVGIDLAGPVSGVVIGGNIFADDTPIVLPGGTVFPPKITVIANNGRLSDGAGIRVGEAADVVITRAYVGLSPPWTSAGNHVGIQILDGATGVRVEGSHLGDNVIADVEVDGATGVRLAGNLHAGRNLETWTKKHPFPTMDAGLSPGPCGPDNAPGAPVTVTAGFAGSASGVAVLVGDAQDVRIEGGAMVGAGVAILDSTDVSVVGTRVANTAGPGVYVQGASATLEQVVVEGAAQSGVWLDGTDDVAVTGCLGGNGAAGLEITGAPVGPGGPRAGRDLPVPSSSAPQEPKGTLFAHLAPRLPLGAGTLLLHANATHGVHAHTGSVPVALAGATSIGNGGDGLRVESYDGPVEVISSAFGLLAGPGADAVHPNEGAGVRVKGTSGVRLGAPGRGLVVSGNGADGVVIDGASGVRIEASFVGTDDTGTVAVPNGGSGVVAAGAEGLSLGAPGGRGAVLVSGNGAHGVQVDASGVAVAARVHNVYAGVDSSGTAALPNEGDGIRVQGCDGAAPQVTGCMVSGNAGAGIGVASCVGPLRLTDNLVGELNPPFAGPNIPLGNGFAGVALEDAEGALLRGNQVAGPGAGVLLTGSHDCVMDANVLRAQGDTQVALVGSSDNRLHANRIDGSAGGGAGVMVGPGSLRNTLSQNRITAHAGSAIALEGGGNAGIPAPVVTAALPSPGGWSFAGTVHPSVPDGSLVELYADEADEARVPVASAIVVGGLWSMTGVLGPPAADLAPAGSLASLFLHATVTDPAGNTSELGPVVLDDPEAAVPVGSCDLGGAPPGDLTGGADALALRVVTLAGSGAATTIGTGVSAVLADLDGVGRAAACGDLVAFAAPGIGGQDLYLRDLVVGVTQTVTSAPGTDTDPAFSWDCQTLAFASDREGTYDLFAVPTSGGTPASLTAGADEDREPSFGPGGALVFARRPVGKAVFGVSRLDGAVTSVIDTAADERTPAWHPGGDRVAFARCEKGRCRVVLRDLATGAESPLTPGGCDDRAPAWVPADPPLLLLARKAVAPAMPAPGAVVLATETGYPLWPVLSTEAAPACCVGAP
ncbi:MAG: hypothetical protein AMXMBFR64_26870 [Myxococcales bacterium]